MQVQSADRHAEEIALGERAVMVDGEDYQVFRDKEAGQPVDVVYPTEGTPLDVGPSAVFKAAPNPERGAAVPKLAAFAPKASSS